MVGDVGGLALQVAGDATTRAVPLGDGAGAEISEREEFLFGIDRILDGVQALIDYGR